MIAVFCGSSVSLQLVAEVFGNGLEDYVVGQLRKLKAYPEWR